MLISLWPQVLIKVAKMVFIAGAIYVCVTFLPLFSQLYFVLCFV